MDKRPFDLEKRLIKFAVRNIRLSEHLPNTKIGNHVRGQLLRCATSPAPNYAEAQSAESRSDFIHKIKIVLKELRETRVWLVITAESALITPQALLDPLLGECDELISIFVKSAQTASSKKRSE